MAALAHYNLGLVSLGAGKRDEAARWFAQSRARDGRRRGCDRWRRGQLAQLPRPPERNWVAFGSAAAGYDDNVRWSPAATCSGVSGTDDTFGELQVAATGPLVGPWRFDWRDRAARLSGSGQLRSAHCERRGARYRLPLGDWIGEAGLQLTYATLDTKASRASGCCYCPGHAAIDRRMAFCVCAIASATSTDSMASRPVMAAATSSASAVVWHRDTWDVRLEYRFDTSDYEDESSSFSRHQLTADVRARPRRELARAVGLSLDRSRYDDPANGSEERFELALSVSRVSTTRGESSCAMPTPTTAADLPEFNYQRNLFSAGVEAAW
jgi:hypothetical protein